MRLPGLSSLERGNLEDQQAPVIHAARGPSAASPNRRAASGSLPSARSRRTATRFSPGAAALHEKDGAVAGHHVPRLRGLVLPAELADRHPPRGPTCVDGDQQAAFAEELGGRAGLRILADLPARRAIEGHELLLRDDEQPARRRRWAGRCRPPSGS